MTRHAAIFSRLPTNVKVKPYNENTGERGIMIV
jgi:hypothetical protein